MSCTLHTLAACFSLSGLYVETAAVVMDEPAYIEQQTLSTTFIQPVLTESGDITPIVDRQLERGTRTQAANPYGRLVLGYSISAELWSVALEASHTSSLATNRDRGINALSLSVRWRPFAR